jgi:dihydrofolate synthase/folylpolyglutamate synthase
VTWPLEEALAWLEGHVNMEADRSQSAADLRLGRMAELAALSGDPQHSAPVIHVTGTNGKGSTTALVTSLLGAHGLTVGTYTSPDLERINERIARNGEPITDDELAQVLADVRDLEDGSGVRASRFELLTLAAYRWFADQAVDVMVVEVGLGGARDATNVADATVAVVTNVGLDHVGVIGPGLADIAREKAGIVKAGSTLVLGETDPELVAIFEAAGPERTLHRDADFGVEANALAVGGRSLDLRTPEARYEDVFLSLNGAHQGDNAILALAATEAFFRRPVDEEVVREAFATAVVPGRFEVVGRTPLVILDGAHNPDGARAAAATLDDFSVDGERILVVGLNAERDPAEMLEALGARSARLVVATAADTPRALAAEDVAAAARALGVQAIVVPGVAEALRRAVDGASPSDVVLVAGSLYVAGAARAAQRRAATRR